MVTLEDFRWVLGMSLLAIGAVTLIRQRWLKPADPAPAADPDPPYPPEAEDEDPEPKTLGDWRNEYEEREVPPGASGWIECSCCGCPAMDGAVDFPECEVCGWDGDVDGIDAARLNFSRYGSVHAPEERAAVGRPPVSPAERRAALDVVEVCSFLEPGEKPIPAFWPVFYEKLDALRRVREDAVR